ncbi:MAG: type II toxin-antitoxin system prevent-host-death family antitoxin [Propionibacteriaceae bacterium]|jgi:prevent-host-death family protein|nr:type II toxin-antitoxin system prevent-host-death family antitoxin [Propionibacteriaceae bacterium]
MSLAISVRELNQNTSAVLQRASAGEHLVIASRGRPVARLIPFTPTGAYEELVTDGQVIMAQPGPEWEPVSIDIGVDELLDDERGEAL